METEQDSQNDSAPNPPDELSVIERNRWCDVIAQHVQPELEPPVRRRARRYGIEFGLARLRDPNASASVPCTATVLQVSEFGLMLRNHEELAKGAEIWIEVLLGDETCSLYGVVRHCTETIGGYKIGVELFFPDAKRT